MSVFEALMLICFGFAWPINIYKSLTSRSTKGKSLLFSIVIELGYLFGIIHKIRHSPDIVMALYILNLVMVGFDLYLYFRNRRYELAKQARAAKAQTEPSSERPRLSDEDLF